MQKTDYTVGRLFGTQFNPSKKYAPDGSKIPRRLKAVAPDQPVLVGSRNIRRFKKRNGVLV